MSEAHVPSAPHAAAGSSPPHAAAGTSTQQIVLDSVTEAAHTPQTPQPYRELGLTDEEYDHIRQLLQRRPTSAELAMYSVMWSEHCSYKSSKHHLRQFGVKTTEVMGQHLLVGIGQNAGVVDIGEGWAVTFKVESHNSPSYVEPYQGAATGIGGIVRDIIAMGARPVAVMDQIRVGPIGAPDTARVLPRALAGIADYAATLGLPTIGGELEFDATYARNPLVNALCLGIMRHSDIQLATASGVGNKVVLFGARTGGDGIGGASLLASDTLSHDTERPTVQVGDPLEEKRIIACCLDAFANGLVEGIQDLGAAGISCATAELAANGEGGMHVDLEQVPLREELTPEEILMSESQERMMAILAPDKLADFLAIAARWDVSAAVIGEVTATGRLTIDHAATRIVDVDPSTVAHDAPVYERPYARPAEQDELNDDAAEYLPRGERPEDIASQLRSLVASPNLAGKSWLHHQLDSQVGGNTVQHAPDDAGVVRVDETTGRGVALSTDANPRFAKLDPYLGAQHALAEAYRNVVCSGARPRAVSDCLNLGSPQEPGAMWQLVDTITGLADGCQELGVPVTGGNVSLYNSTSPAQDGDAPSAIYPTPVVAVLGVLSDVSRALPSGWRESGCSIVVLGTTAPELSGSVWADVVHDHLGGRPPFLDLGAEARLAEVVDQAAERGLLRSAHDLSGGGLAQALVEACLRFGVGAEIDLDSMCERDSLDLTSAMFAESAGRLLLALHPDDEGELAGLCDAAGVAALRIGTTSGAGIADSHEADPALSIADLGSFPLAELRDLSQSTLPDHFD